MRAFIIELNLIGSEGEKTLKYRQTTNIKLFGMFRSEISIHLIAIFFRKFFEIIAIPSGAEENAGNESERVGGEKSRRESRIFFEMCS